MNSAQAFVVGAVVGMVMVPIFMVFVFYAEQVTCMERHKAPACERVVEWHPLRRSE